MGSLYEPVTARIVVVDGDNLTKIGFGRQCGRRLTFYLLLATCSRVKVVVGVRIKSAVSCCMSKLNYTSIFN